MLGHKTMYYGYQGGGYGPLRGHNTMLLPRKILQLGPSGPPGAPCRVNRPSVQRANTGKRICCPGQGGVPPDPLPDFQREHEIWIFFHFVTVFLVLQRGNYGFFLDLAVLFSRLRKSAASGGLRRFSEKSPPPPPPLLPICRHEHAADWQERGRGRGRGTIVWP